ncbi:hypothetical protein LCGC14_1583310 [marine sediment metagenome]|uniref:Uncharacterized protein n=1 Tax=marine sediment metagenome TaxID=412755 RepID=A0A0F9KWX5_9ZZZZ
MKLKFKVIIPFVIIIGMGFSVYFGLFLFPNLFSRQHSTTTIYIAPYISHTHQCHTHGSSCTGELPNQSINYTVRNNDEIIFSGEIITEENGFFQLDLNLNASYAIQMKIFINETLYWSSVEVNTFFGSANCITTGQLTPYS